MDERETEKRQNLSLNTSSVPSNISSNHITHHLLTTHYILLVAWLKATSPRQHSVSLSLNRCQLYLVHSRRWDGAIDTPATSKGLKSDSGIYSLLIAMRDITAWGFLLWFLKREREKLELRKFSGFSQTLDLTRLGTLTDYHWIIKPSGRSGWEVRVTAPWAGAGSTLSCRINIGSCITVCHTVCHLNAVI